MSAVLVVALAIAGCSPATNKTTVERIVSPEARETTAPPTRLTPTPAKTKTPARRPPAKPVRAETEPKSIGRFVTAVQRQMPQFVVDRRDDEVAEIGEQACRSLAAGRRSTAVADEITGYGVAAKDARELVALARDTACRA
jgi:hypothetical protein